MMWVWWCMRVGGAGLQRAGWVPRSWLRKAIMNHAMDVPAPCRLPAWRLAVYHGSMMTRCMMGLGLAMLVVLVGCVSSGRVDQALDSKETASIRAIGQHAIDADGIVGLSVAVSLDGELVFADGFGHADLEKSRPATAETIYDIASVGKQFTAAAVLRLIEDGKLTLDDRIHDIVPATPPHFPNATIEELLHHLSGFRSASLDELNPPPGLDQLREGLAVLDDVGLTEGRIVFEPSASFIYSNSGYLLLGLAVEAASGRSYASYITDEFLRPAGLTKITVSQRPEGPIMADSLHLSGTPDGDEPRQVSRVPFIHMSVYAGQGSICSSAVDMIRWEHALEEYRIINEASFRQFRSPGRVRGVAGEADMPYGAAQRLGDLGGHRKVGHTGTYEGGSAALTHYPETGLSIAVVTNTNGAGVPHALSIEGKIARLILGMEHAAPSTPTPLVPDEIRHQVEGMYSDGRVFEARFKGNTLQVFRDGEVVEELIWVGDLDFRQHDKPRIRQRFVLDGSGATARAGWWVYEVDGLCMEVLRRIGP